MEIRTNFYEVKFTGPIYTNYFDERKVTIMKSSGYFLNSNAIQIPAMNGLFAARDLVEGEKIVLFVGIQTIIESYNKSINNGSIVGGYAHYVNGKYVYSCYANYKSNKCIASAANSHLNYFKNDGNNHFHID